MKVVLIYLPKPFLKQPDAQAPLGLMYVAAGLEKNGHEVVLKNYSAWTDEDAIADCPEADFYGITCTSLEVPQANDFARLLRGKFPCATVGLGGPGAHHEEFVDREVISTVCRGEGDYIANVMLRDLDRGRLQETYVAEVIRDLDYLPLPARHLLEGRQGGNVFAYDHNYTDGDSAVILSTRGCPFNCAFCAAPNLFSTLDKGLKLRARSPRLVAAEMREVIKTYGIRQFRFSDDMFTAGRRRVIDLCEHIGRLGVYWRISCRVRPLDDEMLDAMWEAGCRELSFGIESFDDEVLKGLEKGTTCADNVRALELAAKHGFKTRMLFMVRTPFQSRKTMKLNKYWIQQVPFTIMACTSFVPIPGCEIWYNPDRYGIEILDRDVRKYNFYMYGPEGKRALEPIIKIKDRPLDEFMQESEELRLWAEEYGRVNRG